MVVLIQIPITDEWLLEDSDTSRVNIGEEDKSGHGHHHRLVLVSTLRDERNVEVGAHLVTKFLAERVGVNAVEVVAAIEKDRAEEHAQE
jgi:hypothetical protein